jgi:LuxR family transcriptional regulator, maltose regulon positive regulatory protein
MPAALLSTKYRLPPAAPDRVKRVRLLERLDELLAPGLRLGLVSAPAGSGKTTLARAWIEHLNSDNLASEPTAPLRIAWLSLDEEDNDLATFLAYLTAALQAASLDFRAEQFANLLPNPLPSQPGPLPPMRVLLAGLINQLAELAGLTVLVLEDYHFIAAAPVHECVGYLLEHLPENTRLVILTRAESLLPISRLRVRGQLVEIREADLCFNLPETVEFFNACMGLQLKQAEIELLAQRTEGWAAGLQMAALALRALPDAAHKSTEFIQTFTGSHRFVLDYLMDEVFTRLPEETRSFLLDTAILDRFCAGLCAEMLEELPPQGIEALLLSLQNSNLFLIPLDDQRCWFRYHHLFAELLRSRLRQSISLEKLDQRLRRAAAWFASQGLTEEAINYSLQAGDFEGAAGLIESCSRELLSRGQQSKLQHWVAALPAELVIEHPLLRMYQALAHFLSGESSIAVKIITETNQSLERLPQSAELRAVKYELLSILAMSSLNADDTQRVTLLAQDALDQMPDTEFTPRARLLFAQSIAYSMVGDKRSLSLIDKAQELALQAGNLYLVSNIIAYHAFGLTSFLLQLHTSWKLSQQIIDLCNSEDGDKTHSYLAGAGLIGQAGVALEWYDLDTAARLLNRGMELSRQGGIIAFYFYALLTQAHLAQARGDFPAASAILDEATRHNSLVSNQMTVAMLIQAQVRLHLSAGHTMAAARWAHGVEIPIGPNFLGLAQEILDLSLARVLLAEGHTEEALGLTEKLIIQAESGRRLAHVLKGSLIQAVALHKLHRDALAPLRRALQLSQAEGATLFFHEVGKSVQELLLAYRPRLGDLTREADRLLRQMHPQGEQDNARTPCVPELVEQLTPRELEVLRLVYAGKSNLEIAAALYLSLSAIKKHTGNIYGKLGVASRAQAIARARELKLV